MDVNLTGTIAEKLVDNLKTTVLEFSHPLLNHDLLLVRKVCNLSFP